MKRTLMIAAALFFAAVLCACGCRHQWLDATCTAPSTCAQCAKQEGAALGHTFSQPTCDQPGSCTRCGAQEGAALGHDLADATCDAPAHCLRCDYTEGSPLGHEFSAATCEAPETCTRCGARQGEPLGHSFGIIWCSDGETQMYRECRVCRGRETAPMDREAMMYSILEGYWHYYFGITPKDEPIVAHFREDRTVTFYFEDDSTMDAQVIFEEYIYATDEEYENYSGNLLWEDGAVSDFSIHFLCTEFAVEASPEMYIFFVDLPPVNPGYYDGMYTKAPAASYVLEGTWAAFVDGTLYRIDFYPDFTFQAQFGENTFSGTWLWKQVFYDNDTESVPRTMRLALISWEREFDGIDLTLGLGTAQVPLTEYALAGQYEPLIIDNMGVHLQKTTPEAIEDIYASMEGNTEKESAKIYGTWKSAYRLDASGNRQEKTDLQITFAQDGTFTSNLSGMASGTWKINDFGPFNPSGYTYTLSCGSGSCAYASISGDALSLVKGSEYLYFYQEEAWNTLMASKDEAETAPIGTWYSAGYLDAQGSYRLSGDHCATFAADGTFTFDTYTGTWQLDTVDAQGVAIAQYSVRFDGSGKTARFDLPLYHGASLSFYGDNVLDFAYMDLTREPMTGLEAQRDHFPGVWTLRSASCYSPETQEGIPAEAPFDTLTVREDGTFLLRGDDTLEGTWQLCSAGSDGLLFNFESGGTYFLLSLYDGVLSGGYPNRDGQYISIRLEK